MILWNWMMIKKKGKTILYWMLGQLQHRCNCFKGREYFLLKWTIANDIDIFIKRWFFFMLSNSMAKRSFKNNFYILLTSRSKRNGRVICFMYCLLYLKDYRKYTYVDFANAFGKWYDSYDFKVLDVIPGKLFLNGILLWKKI